MKVVLTALNAKYIHTSLSIRYLKACTKKYSENIHLTEYTINNQIDDILRELYRYKPDILGFSCYIWNIEMVKKIVKTYKKISPNTIIFLGGPEVSYDSETILEELKEVTFIIKGEGEETFKEIMEYYINKKGEITKIKGLVIRKHENIIVTGNRIGIDLNEIPFPYENELDKYNNQIIYYETTRGCPFNCQYCLSSIEKGVRYRDINIVKNELKQFLDAKVMQVKFVDRTFNCSKTHALEIWKYLHENDNDYTNFHFEISADLLDDEILTFLKKPREGLFQFEIGVQSTNLVTIDYIKRKMDFEKLSNVVKKINKLGNIHQHLDLIAGLPGENYNSFKNSFNDVYNLKPEQLQLGFLKVLKGSGLHDDKEKYGLVYMENAPYEILRTNDMSYEDILSLKMIEEMVEIYYNSGRFIYTVNYIEEKFQTPFDFYEELSKHYVENNYHHCNHSKLKYYDILLEFYEEKIKKNDVLLKWFMKFDIYLHEKAKKLPKWLDKEPRLEYKSMIIDFYKIEKNIHKYLPELKEYTSKQISRMAHIEVFPFDIIRYIEDKEYIKEDTAVLFNYCNRGLVVRNARVERIRL